MKTAVRTRYSSVLLPVMALLMLSAFPVRHITAQPIRCSIETDKQHYIHDEPVLALLRVENLTAGNVRVRFTPVEGGGHLFNVVNGKSGATYTLYEPEQRAFTIDAFGVNYHSRKIELFLLDEESGSTGYLPSGDWYLDSDMIVTTDDGTEYEVTLRALIHVQARTEGDTPKNMVLEARVLTRERHKTKSEEYELPAEFHDLMNSPNNTPYRNGVIGYYYSFILSKVGREIEKKQGSLHEYRPAYVDRLLRYFAAWPDEVLTVHIWHNTIGLMVAPPPDVCERALAIPGIGDTRLGRYLREYACVKRTLQNKGE